MKEERNSKKIIKLGSHSMSQIGVWSQGILNLTSLPQGAIMTPELPQITFPKFPQAPMHIPGTHPPCHVINEALHRHFKP